jgi:TRAP-type C4-dicarboxylate transport system permease small subunit
LLLPEDAGLPVNLATLPSWLRGLRRCLDFISGGLLALAMLVLLLVFCLMNVEIISRSLFGVSTLISDEYSGYGFAFVIMAGLMYAHRSGALLRVEFGAGLMTRRMRAVSLCLASLASLAATGLAAVAGYRTWALSWLFDSTSNFASSTPLWLPQIAVPIGLALLALSFTEEFLTRAWIAAREV